MADLGIYNFKWVRGTTMPFIVSMKIDDVPIPYDDIRLSVYNGTTLVFRLSLHDNEGTEPGSVEITSPGVFSFRPTAAQTRMLTKVAADAEGKSSYEVEIRDGLNESVYLLGTIAGIGGLNDDEEEVS
jgi:hypothetical protein